MKPGLVVVGFTLTGLLPGLQSSAASTTPLNILLLGGWAAWVEQEVGLERHLPGFGIAGLQPGHKTASGITVRSEVDGPIIGGT